VRENWCCTKESRLPCRTSATSLRLVALVVLHLHTLKENILPGHRDFPVQHEFARTRHPLYLIIHTNNPPVGPICQSLSFSKLFHPSFSGLSLSSHSFLLCSSAQPSERCCPLLFLPPGGRRRSWSSRERSRGGASCPGRPLQATRRPPTQTPSTAQHPW
jgi:hypothetical protein